MKNTLNHKLPFFPHPSIPEYPLLVSAPLAGISHGPLRRIWAELGGCDIYFSEMISAEAFVSCSPFRDYYLDDAGQGSRSIFQLVSPVPDTMNAAAGELIQRFESASERSGQRSALGIDINMGCSAPEIVRQGAGVEWMKKPESVLPMLQKLRLTVPAGTYSLSVKIRLGEDDDFPRLLGFCTMLEESGIDFITLHPRIRKDPWGRPAKSSRICSLAAQISLPVIANGDLGTPERMGDFLSSWKQEVPGKTCPGIMTGRGAVSNPWLFDEVKNRWAAEDDSTATLQEVQAQEGDIASDRIALARHFHQLLETLLPKEFWFSRTKRFYAWYCMPLMFGNRIASRIQSIPSYEKILPLFEEALRDSKERFVRRSSCRKV